MYSFKDDKPQYHPIPSPSTEEVESLLETIIKRTARLLEKKNLIEQTLEEPGLAGLQ